MSLTSGFQIGQRWTSVSEPELGLGEVRTEGARTITLWFEATQETRQYANDGHAPLRRAAFRPGDTITGLAQGEAQVRAVSERNGLLYYDCGDGEWPETELSHALSFSSPLQRLFAGEFDPSDVFDLRASALTHQSTRRASEVRGFVGGRIDLLPHQLGIASEVTSRLIPRVLLADEVGLGKTIEAGLILHRLLLTGRAQRVLIVVPESLVHQWFLELLRRFNLWFHIFDEPRCAAIQDADAAANPFLDDQLLLCELGLFIRNPGRLEEALEAGWDMVVVDEAHHLEWTPTAASPGYTAVERLGRVSPGLLLLTATPEQFGTASHFARLRLLDPARFHDLALFTNEASEYRIVAHLARLLMESSPLSPDERTRLAGILGEPLATIDAALRAGDGAASAAWLEKLLDQHGTGRVMFRNTRFNVSGFPSRVAHLYSMAATSPARSRALAEEWASDTGAEPEPKGHQFFAHDPRIDWLASLLQSLGRQKVLLICRTERKVMAIESALRRRTTIPMAVFHEGLSLVQRDRGAAWFADPHGARLLICSEIGSEGRNFQFCHHLVLFDLPLDPALLEQRLGRLDRIGQRAEIQVHVPVVQGSHLDTLARWYHDGLNAFEEQLAGGRELLERFEPQLRDLATRSHGDRRTVPGELDRFIATVQLVRTEVAERLKHGRDRLLEWNSSNPARSTQIIDRLHLEDGDRTLETFMLRAFDLFLIEVQELAPRTYRLGSAGVLVDEFPGLKSDGLTFTCDRQRALQREDLQFLTWDHPLVTGALDLLLGSERGNCGFARWPDAAVSALYLEAVYVLESLAPTAMHIDRFLPPTPLRVVVDHRGRDAGDVVIRQLLARQSKPTGGLGLLADADIRDTLLPRLVDRSKELAEERTPALVEHARRDMRTRLQREIARLRDLQKVNRTVRDEEIALLVDQLDRLERYLDDARLRLDAVRLIHRGPQR